MQEEIEGLAELVELIKEDSPILVLGFVGLVGLVLLIVFSVRVIKQQYRQSFVQNEEFGKRAQRVLAQKVGREVRYRVVDSHYEDEVRKVHEPYSVAVYEYVVDGITYRTYYEEFGDRSRPDQHEFLYDTGKPGKVYWAKEAYSPRGKKVQLGCLLSVLAGAVFLFIMWVLGTAMGAMP